VPFIPYCHSILPVIAIAEPRRLVLLPVIDDPNASVPEGGSTRFVHHNRILTTWLSNFHPEFRSALDAFNKFVLGRTRPKQLGASTMTDPTLAEFTVIS
jgi:hypothetical protein